MEKASAANVVTSSQSQIRDSRSAIRADSDEKAIRILVTVGTDLPFDRLVKAVDEWAKRQGCDDVFAQIGETDWTPSHIQYARFVEPPDFTRLFQAADLIISHAGMGTILSALRYRKRLVVMPRKASLGEHRNEHQLATAKYLTELNKVNVAADESELIATLDHLDALPVKDPIGPHASASLIGCIRDFIAAGR